MNDVLSRTAGYLQHNAPGGQNARKNIEYRAFVALCRGEEPFPVSLLLATLPKHQRSVKANSLLKNPQNDAFVLKWQRGHCSGGKGRARLRHRAIS